MGTIRRGFGKFPIVLYIWALMKCSTLAVYASFCYWTSRRLGFSPKCESIGSFDSHLALYKPIDMSPYSVSAALATKIWDYSWLVILILYQIMFIVLPTKTVITEDLPVGSSLIILMEQVCLFFRIITRSNSSLNNYEYLMRKQNVLE